MLSQRPCKKLFANYHSWIKKQPTGGVGCCECRGGDLDSRPRAYGSPALPLHVRNFVIRNCDRAGEARQLRVSHRHELSMQSTCHRLLRLPLYRPFATEAVPFPAKHRMLFRATQLRLRPKGRRRARVPQHPVSHLHSGAKGLQN